VQLFRFEALEEMTPTLGPLGRLDDLYEDEVIA
jgi:hypothetical protein